MKKPPRTCSRRLLSFTPTPRGLLLLVLEEAWNSTLNRRCWMKRWTRVAKRKVGLWLAADAAYPMMLVLICIGGPFQAGAQVKAGVCVTGTSSGRDQRPYDRRWLEAGGTVSVRGQVVDQDQRPVRVAVRLLRGPRDTIALRAVRSSPLTGEFAMDSIPLAAMYILEVSSGTYLGQWHQLKPLPNATDSICVRMRKPAMELMPSQSVPRSPG